MRVKAVGWAVVGPAWVGLVVGPLAADPLPIEQPAYGGQVVPARAVPVDMLSEVLTADVTPRPAPTAPSAGPPTPAEAQVRVEYHLRADERLTVPILFPSLGPIDAVRVRLNGGAVACEVRGDRAVLKPYEAAWRAVIERAVNADAALKAAAAEAREAHARFRRETPAPSARPGLPRMDLDAMVRLTQRCDRWWLARGVGEQEAQELAWALTHQLLDDWQEVYDRGLPGLPAGPDAVERIRLWSAHRLAVHLDGRTPDPVALWQGPEVNPLFETMSFVFGSLALRRGDNTLRVEYRQPVSTVNRPAPLGREFRSSHVPLPQFGFILRTARFWRSFGGLSVDVRLPAGTRWAECSLPGATVQVQAEPARVGYQGHGLPERNLTVVFGARAPGPAKVPAPGGAETAPTVELPVLWDVTVTRGHGYGRAVPVADATHVVAAVGRDGVILDRTSGRVVAGFAADGDVDELRLDGGTLLVGAHDGPHGQQGTLSLAAAYDLTTGRRRWLAAVPEGQDVFAGPKLVKVGDLVVGWARGGGAFAVAAGDGVVRWRQPFAAQGLTLSPEAAAGQRDGTVYLAGRPGVERYSNGRPADPGRVLALRADTGQELWRREVGGEVTGVALDGRRLLVTVGTHMSAPAELVALSASSGEVLWRKPTDVRYGFMEVLLARRQPDGLLVLSSTEASLYDLAQGRRRWTIDYGGQIRCDPTLRGDELFLSTYRGIACLDLHTRAFRWRYPESSVGQQLAVEGDTLFVRQTVGGGLTAYRLPRDDAAPTATPGVTAAPQGGRPPAELGLLPPVRRPHRLPALLAAGVLLVLLRRPWRWSRR